MKNTGFLLLQVRQSPEKGGLRKFMVVPFWSVLILLMMVACSRTAPVQPAVISTPQLPEATEKSPPQAITPGPLKKAPPSQPIQSVTQSPTTTPLRTEAAPLPDLPSTPGDPSRGERLIGAAGCNGCHTVRGVGGNVGPDLTAVARRAPGRAASQKLEKPELYLVQSLVYPRAYIVEGFNPVMPNWKELQLNERDLSDLVAYLMTLSGE